MHQMRLRGYRPFQASASETVKPSGCRKHRKIRQILRSPARIAADEWRRAILAVDRHSQGCRSCNKLRNDPGLQVQTGALLNPHLDPYRPCRKARGLEDAELVARNSYRAAGFPFPVPMGLKALLLVLVPAALFWASCAPRVVL